MEISGRDAARMLGMAFGMSNEKINEIIGDDKTDMKVGDLQVNSTGETFSHAMHRVSHNMH